MMHSTFILRLGDRWLQFDGQQLSVLEAFPKCAGPVCVVDDFAGAPAGSRALDGKPEHAAALIERQVRSEGLVDGESHVLIHKRVNVPGGIQALFTAVPVEQWQQSQAWAQAQPDHCQIVPLLALLGRHVENGKGLVLNYGRQLVFLAQQGSSLRYASMMAFSEHPDDLMMALASLGDQVRSMLSGNPLELLWCALDQDAALDEEALLATFQRSSGVALHPCPVDMLVREDGQKRRSGVRHLLSAWSGADAINPPADHVLARTEDWLPAASVLALVLALALFAYAGYMAFEAKRIALNAQSVTAQADSLSMAAQKRLAQELRPVRYPAIQQFLGRVGQINTSFNPYRVMAAVRDAAGVDARILRVRLDKDGKTDATIVIDGVLKESALDGQGLSRVIARLRTAGYEPSSLNPADATQSAAFFSYRLLRKDAR